MGAASERGLNTSQPFAGTGVSATSDKKSSEAVTGKTNKRPSYGDLDFDDDANPFGDKLPWREENKSKDRKKPHIFHPDTHWD